MKKVKRQKECRWCGAPISYRKGMYGGTWVAEYGTENNHRCRQQVAENSALARREIDKIMTTLRS